MRNVKRRSRKTCLTITLTIMPLWLSEISCLEAVGAATGALSVWLAARNSVWCWLWGIVSVLLYAAVFFDARLYADMALQGVFCVINAYGWREWLHGGGGGKARAIGRFPSKWIAPAVALTATCAALGAAFLRWRTDADLPEADALLTAMSLCAVWMQARRYVESWLVWIVADTLYVGLFVVKSLWLTALLYAVFIGMAMHGFREWKRLLALQSAATLS
jgi:nicotinamide mononucleotide transporter